MNNTNPLISVIIPVYNGAKFLTEALASVVGQTYRPLEIIVIDDGSTDDTAQIANTFFAGTDVSGRCLFQENQGPAAARNHGLSLASGKFIAFLDADDVWPNARIDHHLELFAKTPETDIVIGPVQIVERRPGLSQSMASSLPAPLIQQQLGSATCRRTVFSRVGLFNPDLRYGEDRDWFQRALQLGVNIQMTRRVALRYSIRPGSLTYGRVDQTQGFLAALRAELKRRRQREHANK